MRKLVLNSAQWVREQIRTSVKTPCEPHFLHRLHCLLLIAEGRSCYEVARWFGGKPRTIERWVHAFHEHGIDGLREHHMGGRPRTLTGEHAQHLVRELRQPPQVFGYQEPQWSGTLLTRHLDRSYGIRLSTRQCQRILRRLTRAGPTAAA